MFNDAFHGCSLLNPELPRQVTERRLTGGRTFYRTVFYTPHFVAGVATFILWKKLYSQQSGPINAGLQPVLNAVADAARSVPPLFTALGWAGMVAMVVLLAGALRRLVRWRVDGELGDASAVLATALLLLPTFIACLWSPAWPYLALLAPGAVLSMAYAGFTLMKAEDRFAPRRASEGLGNALMVGLALMTGQFILMGLAVAVSRTPAMAEDGVLAAPSWLNDPAYAKPALMFMGFWAAIGSNNMLLYLAALTNVPGELYEASDIDGASPMQRFWNVTWPQLAPTTFFILVMSTIGGLQGGFEMARVMTRGGPAGATTTLSYYIYIEGFEAGRLGFASAIAWALFVLIFGVTLFNWRVGGRYVNE